MPSNCAARLFLFVEVLVKETPLPRFKFNLLTGPVTLSTAFVTLSDAKSIANKSYEHCTLFLKLEVFLEN